MAGEDRVTQVFKRMIDIHYRILELFDEFARLSAEFQDLTGTEPDIAKPDAPWEQDPDWWKK
jgi:hypothetical protein